MTTDDRRQTNDRQRTDGRQTTTSPKCQMTRGDKGVASSTLDIPTTQQSSVYRSVTRIRSSLSSLSLSLSKSKNIYFLCTAVHRKYQSLHLNASGNSHPPRWSTRRLYPLHKTITFSTTQLAASLPKFLAPSTRRSRRSRHSDAPTAPAAPDTRNAQAPALGPPMGPCSCRPRFHVRRSRPKLSCQRRPRSI